MIVVQSVASDTYYITGESEEDAKEQVLDGQHDPNETNFYDWEITSCEEVEG